MGDHVHHHTHHHSADLGSLAGRLECIEGLLRRVLANQGTQETIMSELTDAVDRLKREVAESRAAFEAAVAYIKTVPGLVRDAVAAALAANPTLDPKTLNDFADSLDAGQAELLASLPAAPAAEPAPPPSDVPPPSDLPPAG